MIRFFKGLVLWSVAAFGFLLCGGFFAIRFGWTNVSGTVDSNTAEYNRLASIPVAQEVIPVPDVAQAEESTPAPLTATQIQVAQQFCLIQTIGTLSPSNAGAIVRTYAQNPSVSLLIRMVGAAVLRLNDHPEITTAKQQCQEASTYTAIDSSVITNQYITATGTNAFTWVNSPEWQTITTAIAKDKDEINKAATVSGVPAREIVAVCVVEQLRLYNTQRELFERVFKPLNLLGTATKMAWGTMAIKEQTAIDVENHLHDATSPYYLGPDKENALAFTTSDETGERYRRLTNEHDHTYSYLYGALYLAEVEKQWERAGYPIADRPEILATLYNVGFNHSSPKADPQVGGSTLEIGGSQYTFGGLAYEFYYSAELTDLFPYP